MFVHLKKEITIMTEQKVVIITGASSGMGEASAKLFLKRGWIVYAGARRVERMAELKEQGAHVVALDVTKPESNQNLVAQVVDEQGRIDVLINNAGYGEFGPAETIPMDHVRAQFEVNFFGAVDLIQQVLPTMRQQHSGRIVNISSIGGDIYMPLGAYYHATKAALQQFSDTLDIEVRPFGIRSTIVQPGGTQSEWSEIAMQHAKENLGDKLDYLPLVKSVEKALGSFSTNVTSADLARIFYRAATDQHTKRRYLNSFSDRATVCAARAMPNVYKKALVTLVKRMDK